MTAVACLNQPYVHGSQDGDLQKGEAQMRALDQTAEAPPRALIPSRRRTETEPGQEDGAPSGCWPPDAVVAARRHESFGSRAASAHHRSCAAQRWPETKSESPGLSRRLQPLRGWSHGQTKDVPQGSQGACRASRVRTRARAFLVVAITAIASTLGMTPQTLRKLVRRTGYAAWVSDHVAPLPTPIMGAANWRSNGHRNVQRGHGLGG